MQAAKQTEQSLFKVPVSETNEIVNSDIILLWFDCPEQLVVTHIVSGYSSS